MSYFENTDCCALRHLVCHNDDTKSSIINTVKEAIVERYDESLDELDGDDSLTFFAITTPSEDLLCKTLESLGFEEQIEFPRVQVDGLLKMWTKTFSVDEVL